MTTLAINSISSATSMAQMQAQGNQESLHQAKAASAGHDPQKVASQFASFVLRQFTSAMMQGATLKDDNSIFGGGFAEEMYEGMMSETLADSMGTSGFGAKFAEPITRHLLALQEVADKRLK